MSRRKPGAKKPRKAPRPAAERLARRRTAGIKPELPLPPDRRMQDKPSVALVVAVVLTAVLEVLDITIVSVAIPHMLGTFGATSDQITWVLTSYLVSAAVVMPLTGYLSARLGRRRLLIFSIVGFVISSALCGLSWNLESMVVFRLAARHLRRAARAFEPGHPARRLPAARSTARRSPFSASASWWRRCSAPPSAAG